MKKGLGATGPICIDDPGEPILIQPWTFAFKGATKLSIDGSRFSLIVMNECSCMFNLSPLSKRYLCPFTQLSGAAALYLTFLPASEPSSWTFTVANLLMLPEFDISKKKKCTGLGRLLASDLHVSPTTLNATEPKQTKGGQRLQKQKKYKWY